MKIVRGMVKSFLEVVASLFIKRSGRRERSRVLTPPKDHRYFYTLMDERREGF